MDTLAMEKEYLKNRGIRCPACKSLLINCYEEDKDGDEIIFDCRCKKCCAVWKDIYKLVGISDLEIPEEKENNKKEE